MPCLDLRRFHDVVRDASYDFASELTILCGWVPGRWSLVAGPWSLVGA